MCKGPALLLEDMLLVLALSHSLTKILQVPIFFICKTKENNTKLQVCREDWK